MKKLLKNINVIDWIKQNLSAPQPDSSEGQLLSRTGTIVFVIGAGLLALYLQTAGSQETAPPENERFSLDTQIPQGYGLHPVEIVNYEYLDSIIGEFGRVNLYSVPLNKNDRPKSIAKNVKIVRSAAGGAFYAALLSEKDGFKLLKHPGPYQVTVKNPKFNTGTQFEKEIQRKRSRIQYILE